MNQTTANVAVILASISTVLFLIPQIVKLIKTRNPEGVSSTWPVLGFVINVGWFVYLISQQLWASILAPLFTFISYGVIVWALARTGRDLGWSYLRGAATTVVLVSITMVWGWTALGVLLGISYAVVLAPSIWTAYKTAVPTGISPSTWWIGLIEALLWGFYGWFHSDRGILTFMVVGVVGSLLMLTRFYRTQTLLNGAGVTPSGSRPM